jgi:hypothetical protein
MYSLYILKFLLCYIQKNNAGSVKYQGTVEQRFHKIAMYETTTDKIAETLVPKRPFGEVPNNPELAAYGLANSVQEKNTKNLEAIKKAKAREL